VFWRRFRKTSGDTTDDAWWRRADEVSAAPDAAAVDALEEAIADDDHHHAISADAERQREMIDGLREVLVVASSVDLPVVATQHRVIGQDTCHLVAPVTLVAEAAAPGKLFVTSARLLFAGGRVIAWPWHRVQRVTRQGRDLVVAGTTVNGGPLHLQCNTYGDALLAAHLAARLRGESASA
jgi:hypothetical protein